MNLKLAYLSRGKLFFKNGDLAAQEIDSQFGQDIINRTLQRQQRHEWETQGANTPFSGAMLWGKQEDDPRRLRVAIPAAATGWQANTLLFVLETDRVGGLFTYDWINGEERRWFHREALYLRDLAIHLELKLVAGSLHFPNGTANIGLVRGQNMQSITEGDSVDQAPAWVPGPYRQIIFQSAGVARNPQGYALGIGPFAIQQLNLDNGALTPVLEDAQHDLLSPRLTADGSLYFIRRPYETLGRKPTSINKVLEDIVLFPARLLCAAFYFLNFISLTFARKPLTTSGGPQVEGDDEKMVMLRGKMIDARKAMREGPQSDAPALVPPTWELVKRAPSGAEQVLAKAVVTFDLDRDGRVLYSNGTAVYRLNSAGQAELLFKDKLIEDLIVVG